MIFLASKKPMEAVPLQKTLLESYNFCIDIYLSLHEVEENLYKLPDIIFIDENLEIPDLISLTQSIKAYDPEIQVVWLCKKSSPYLEKIYKSYGVYHCLKKEDYFLERISLLILEIKQQPTQKIRSQRKKAHMKRIILNKPSSSSFHRN